MWGGKNQGKKKTGEEEIQKKTNKNNSKHIPLKFTNNSSKGLPNYLKMDPPKRAKRVPKEALEAILLESTHKNILICYTLAISGHSRKLQMFEHFGSKINQNGMF